MGDLSFTRRVIGGDGIGRRSIGGIIRGAAGSGSGYVQRARVAGDGNRIDGAYRVGDGSRGCGSSRYRSTGQTSENCKTIF